MARPRADMHEPHDAGGVDQDVSALLHGIGGGPSRETAPGRFAGVGQESGRSQKVAPARAAHPVRPVERAGLVTQHGPGRTGLFDVCTSARTSLERDDQHADAERVELPLRPLQLQQVPPARQSTQVPVQHEQQPRPAAGFERVHAAAGVRQPEGKRGLTRAVRHSRRLYRPDGRAPPFDTVRSAGHAYRSREELRVSDNAASPTLLQRAVLWILHALMFYFVALYPVYLMARFEPDSVVHYGFVRWMAVVLILYWTALQLFFTERPRETRWGRALLAVTAAIVLVIGTFRPIVSFSFVGSVDYFRDGYGDGYILLIMAGLSLALAVTGRWKQVLVPALGSLAMILWTFLSVQDTMSQVRSGAAAALTGNPYQGLAPSVMQSIQWEWGWVLLFAGSGLLVYSAARRDQSEPESPPLVTVRAEDEPAGAAAEPEAAAPVEEPAAVEPEAAAPVEEPAAVEPEAAAPVEEPAAVEPEAEESGAGSSAAEAPAEEPAPEPKATAAVPTEEPAAEEPTAEAPAEEPATAAPVTADESADAPESAPAEVAEQPQTPPAEAAEEPDAAPVEPEETSVPAEKAVTTPPAEPTPEAPAATPPAEPAAEAPAEEAQAAPVKPAAEAPPAEEAQAAPVGPEGAGATNTASSPKPATDESKE